VKNSSNSKNHQIKVDSREFLGQSHQPKRHKVFIRDPNKNPQEIFLKTPLKNHKEELRKSPKGKLERQHKALRNHAESSIHTMKVHIRSSLPPDHPSLSLDLT
jgi:hypothetical protein